MQDILYWGGKALLLTSEDIMKYSQGWRKFPVNSDYIKFAKELDEKISNFDKEGYVAIIVISSLGLHTIPRTVRELLNRGHSRPDMHIYMSQLKKSVGMEAYREKQTKNLRGLIS